MKIDVISCLILFTLHSAFLLYKYGVAFVSKINCFGKNRLENAWKMHSQLQNANRKHIVSSSIRKMQIKNCGVHKSYNIYI